MVPFLKSAILVSAGLIVLSACSSAPTASTRVATTTAPAAATGPVESTDQRPAILTVPTKGLPAQTLEPGDCGLFLWSQTDARKFIFFRRAGDGFANMLIGETNAALIATDFSGDIFGQFFTEQKFDSRSTGHTIDLSFSPGEELNLGARISSGRIRVLDPEGWVTTIPIVGVRACQPQPDPATEANASR